MRLNVTDGVESSGPSGPSMLAAQLGFTIELVARVYCTSWGGIAPFSCSCNAALPRALLSELVQRSLRSLRMRIGYAHMDRLCACG